MFTSATPGVSPPTAATPTIAQSWARRLNFSNAQPAPSVFGTRTSVMISSGASAVSRKSRKKSSAAITRSPPLPRTTMLPRSASTTAGRSDAGSPCASDPPSVPRWRTCGSPTSPAAALRIGTCCRTSASCSTSWCRVSPPMASSSPRVAHVGEVVEATDVDEHRRRRQPQLHQRQQRVPAGEQLGVVAVLGQHRDRLVDRVGPGVGEGGGDHAAPRHLGRAGHHRGHDVVVAGAAAEVALEPDAHLVLVERAALGRQPDRGHHHARSAVPALEPVVLAERGLHRVQRRRRRRAPRSW